MWPDNPVVVCFLIALPQPMRFPSPNRFFVDTNDGIRVPWADWNEYKNFVGMEFYSVASTKSTKGTMEDAVLQIALDKIKPLPGEPLPIPHVITDPDHEFGEYPALDTIVELAAPLIPTNSSIDDSLQWALDRCLTALNVAGQAYQIATSDLRYFPINVRNVPHTVPMYFQLNDFTQYYDLAFVQIHQGFDRFPEVIPDLTESEIHHFDVSMRRIMNGDPLMQWIRRIREARRLVLVAGDASGSVVNTYTAIEIMFNTVLLLLAWENGTPRIPEADSISI